MRHILIKKIDLTDSDSKYIKISTNLHFGKNWLIYNHRLVDNNDRDMRASVPVCLLFNYLIIN